MNEIILVIHNSFLRCMTLLQTFVAQRYSDEDIAVGLHVQTFMVEILRESTVSWELPRGLDFTLVASPADSR